MALGLGLLVSAVAFPAHALPTPPALPALPAPPDGTGAKDAAAEHADSRPDAHDPKDPKDPNETPDAPDTPDTPDMVPQGDANAPARRYAAMDAAKCERELRARHVSFVRAGDARGVLLPVRLTGPIRGVTYKTALGEKARATSPYEITDCRLALALDDFAKILAAHDVVQVIHYSMYRPPGQRELAPGALGKRHSGALAIDAGAFIKRDGTKIDVERDFHGGIGQRACGVPLPADPHARELREIVCAAAAGHLFNVALTPDYNWQHRNHFHLEVTPNVTWFIVH